MVLGRDGVSACPASDLGPTACGCHAGRYACQGQDSQGHGGHVACQGVWSWKRRL